MHDPALPASLNQQTLIDSTTAVDVLVRAEGNVHLAAENLGLTPQIIIASIARDPAAQESLNLQLRTLATLQTYEIFRMTAHLMEETLEELSADERAKFFKDIAKIVATGTAPPATNAQPPDMLGEMLRRLPPEVRQALFTLAPGAAPDVSDEDAAA